MQVRNIARSRNLGNLEINYSICNNMYLINLSEIKFSVFCKLFGWRVNILNYFLTDWKVRWFTPAWFSILLRNNWEKKQSYLWNHYEKIVVAFITLQTGNLLSIIRSGIALLYITQKYFILNYHYVEIAFFYFISCSFKNIR